MKELVDGMTNSRVTKLLRDCRPRGAAHGVLDAIGKDDVISVGFYRDVVGDGDVTKVA